MRDRVPTKSGLFREHFLITYLLSEFTRADSLLELSHSPGSR
jgi:hypothetical protein